MTATHSADGEPEPSVLDYLHEVEQYLGRLIHDPDSVLRFLLEDHQELLHDLIEELGEAEGDDVRRA